MSIWFVLILLQGQGLVGFTYSSLAECQAERSAVMTRQDLVIAASECTGPVLLQRLPQPEKAGMLLEVEPALPEERERGRVGRVDPGEKASAGVVHLNRVHEFLAYSMVPN